MGYMSASNVFADYDGDGTRDGLLRELNIGNGLNGTLINGVLSLEVSGGGGSANDGTITLTAGTNISGGGDFTTNQLSAEEITFNGLTDAQIRALITGTSPISVSAAGVVSFSGGLNDLSDVTITSAAEAQILRHNGTNFVNEYNDVFFIRVKAREAITKGEVVYVFDAHNANVVGVKKARANSASTMPAIGIAYENLSLDDEGLVVAFGKANGVAANHTEGDTLYVSTATAGALTNTKPTGATDLIQNVGILMQAHASNAVVKVTGVGRTNDVPNTINIAGGLTAGSLTTGGAAALGDTTITGKLTVTGLIDPTGLELTPVASNPGSVAANTIWQDSANSNQWKIGAYRVADANNIATLGAAAGLLTGISGQDTDDLSEGSTNLYFTNARARSALSVGAEAAAAGDGGISYSSSTGVFTYTPPDLSNYQVQDDILDDIAGLTQASDKLIYFDSATTAATSSITAFGRSILDDANAAAARTTLGVDAAGTDNSTDVTLVSVTDNYLSLSGQAITAGTVPVSLGGTGATTASAARTALGVDAAGTDNSTDVTLATVAGNYLSLSGQQITAGTVPVSLGGTGATTASAARTALGVDAAGTDNSTDVTLATVTGNYLSISGQEITAGTVPVSLGGTGSSTASAARTALGLAIGSDVQAYDADLAAIAGLSSNDGNFIVGSATGWVAESGSTARTSLGLGTAAVQDVGNFLVVANNLNDIADAGAARTNLGVAVGSDVQAYDADLTAIAGLSSADGNFIVGSASGWVAESGATARTSLGLGSAATSDAGDFATLAQGDKADIAHGWGNHASAGYLTAEADTLSDVAGRGASTTQHITVGGITADTNTLHTDNTNNRVGVGTSSPATTLHVVGTIRQSTVTGGKILFADTNGDLSAVTIGTGISFSSGTLSASGAAAGTVTSVAVSGSDGIQVDSGSPITTSGTIALGVDAAALRTHINVADGATANTGALADQDTVGTSDIDNDAVTYAKIQNVSATDRILGRDAAGAGDIEELTPAAVKTMLAITESDITDLGSYLTAEADTLDTVAARGATTTQNLEAASFVKTSGTSSQFLKADGSVDSNTYLTAEADTLDTVAGRGATTGSSLTAAAFVTTGGAPNQFVKGDGSLDPSTYLTSYTETDTLDDVTGRGATSSTAITAPQFIQQGGTNAQFLKADGTADATVYIPTGQYEAGVTPISAKGFIDTGTDTSWISQTEGSRSAPGANSSGSTQVFSNGVNGLVTAWNQDLVTTQGITYSSGIWTIDTAGVYEIHAKLGFLDGNASGSSGLGNPSSSDFIQSFVHILFSSDGTDPTASEILVRGPVQLYTNGTGLSAKGTECRTVRRFDSGDKIAIGVFNRKQSNQSSSLKYRLRSGIYNECSIRRIG